MTSQTTTRRWVSLAEGAEYLGTSEKTVRRLIANGQVSGYRMGRRLIRLDLTELDKLMRPIPNARTIA